jgi:hypothetical protein
MPSRAPLAWRDSTRRRAQGLFRQADHVTESTCILWSVPTNLYHCGWHICFCAQSGMPLSPRLARSWVGPGGAERQHHWWGWEDHHRGHHNHSRLPRLLSVCMHIPCTMSTHLPINWSAKVNSIWHCFHVCCMNIQYYSGLLMVFCIWCHEPNANASFLSVCFIKVIMWTRGTVNTYVCALCWTLMCVHEVTGGGRLHHSTLVAAHVLMCVLCAEYWYAIVKWYMLPM